MSYYDELCGAANSPNLQNRLLFELLCDDTRRPLDVVVRQRAVVEEHAPPGDPRERRSDSSGADHEDPHASGTILSASSLDPAEEIER